jgi:hypothetical protein
LRKSGQNYFFGISSAVADEHAIVKILSVKPAQVDLQQTFGALLVFYLTCFLRLGSSNITDGNRCFSLLYFYPLSCDHQHGLDSVSLAFKASQQLGLLSEKQAGTYY